MSAAHAWYARRHILDLRIGRCPQVGQTEKLRALDLLVFDESIQLRGRDVRAYGRLLIQWG